MENKARKMFAAVVVIMLCAVAIVGIGYAYTASTVNTGNTTTSQYVVLKQSTTGEATTGKYSFGEMTFAYDTLNTALDTTWYKLSAPISPSPSPITTYTAVKIGDVYLSATQTGATPSAPLSITVKSTGMTVGNGWTYIISDGTHFATLSTNSGGEDTWTDTLELPCANNTWTPTQVSLYYGYLTATATANVPSGYIATVPPTNLTDAGKIIFTANIA